MSRRKIEGCPRARECALRKLFDYAAVGESAAKALSR
jgi:hypothetical protein